MNIEYNHRIGNLEVRLKDWGLEMVQWGKSSCWTIARWQEHKDGGFDLRFIGNRPFNNAVSQVDFWTLARGGQEFLDRGAES